MAAADYYLCDVCGAKAFYDTAVNYDRVGDMACICQECAKTHSVRVVPVAAQEEAEPVRWQGRRAYEDEPEWGEWRDLHPDNVEMWKQKAIEKPHMFQLRALYAHPPREAGAAAPDEERNRG